MTLTARRGAKAPSGLTAGNYVKGFKTSLAILIITGLLVLYAASFYNAQDKGAGQFSEVISQLAGIALGFGAMLAVQKIDYGILKKPAVCLSLIGASLIMLALVPIPGIGVMVNGSRRWLKIGPIGFQPSEFAKYAVVLYMARALSRKNTRLNSFFKGLVPMLAIPGTAFFLILLQPNLSTAGSILIVSAVMILMAGAKWRHLLGLGAGGLALGAYYTLSEPYRRERLLSFRDPFKQMSDEGYQLAQSLIAFGSGGLFGTGLGRGRQKSAFLPYPESDFIFAVVGEELGFAGCVAVMAVFFWLIYNGMRIAMTCEDRFGSLLAAGIVAMIGVQTVMNIAVVVGVMPTTGLPLPFFSAGGTSISIVMAAAGLVIRIATQGKTDEKSPRVISTGQF